MSARCGERASSSQDSSHKHAVSRFLGLSLGGAKSERTCLTVLDYYRNHNKSFVVDIFEAIGAQDNLTADQVLLQHVDELSHELSDSNESNVKVMAVDAPLTLPPCFNGCLSQERQSCHDGYEACKRPEIKWMRSQYRRAKEKLSKVKHITPYSQRPVDVYFRYKHPRRIFFKMKRWVPT